MSQEFRLALSCTIPAVGASSFGLAAKSCELMEKASAELKKLGVTADFQQAIVTPRGKGDEPLTGSGTNTGSAGSASAGSDQTELEDAIAKKKAEEKAAKAAEKEAAKAAKAAEKEAAKEAARATKDAGNASPLTPPATTTAAPAAAAPGEATYNVVNLLGAVETVPASKAVERLIELVDNASTRADLDTLLANNGAMAQTMTAAGIDLSQVQVAVGAAQQRTAPKAA